MLYNTIKDRPFMYIGKYTRSSLLSLSGLLGPKSINLHGIHRDQVVNPKGVTLT